MPDPWSGRDRPPSQPRPRPRLIRCIVATALGLIIAVGLIVLIIWLVVRPAPLEYTVEDARVHGFNLTGDALNATFNLNIRAYNRNRHVSIYYDSVDVTVWYSDQMVAFADGAPFFQPHRNATSLHVVAAARATPLMGSVAGGLKHDRSAGEAELEVRVRARVRFKVGIVKTKHYTLKAYCAPVVVHFSSSVPFERTYCDVDI